MKRRKWFFFMFIVYCEQPPVWGVIIVSVSLRPARFSTICSKWTSSVFFKRSCHGRNFIFDVFMFKNTKREIKMTNSHVTLWGTGFTALLYSHPVAAALYFIQFLYKPPQWKRVCNGNTLHLFIYFDSIAFLILLSTWVWAARAVATECPSWVDQSHLISLCSSSGDVHVFWKHADSGTDTKQSNWGSSTRNHGGAVQPIV